MGHIVDGEDQRFGNARDRFDLGAGQLAGSLAAFGEAGAIAATGGAEALTVIGIPPAIATEVAAAGVAVGALANAFNGIYNMIKGDSGGRSAGQRKYKWGECDKCARHIKGRLQSQGKTGAEITVRPGGKYGVLESKAFGPLAGPGGDHIVIESEGRIYDNFRPEGVPASEFWDDLVDSDFIRAQGYVSSAPF